MIKPARVNVDDVLDFNEDSYLRLGFAAQRRFPNEELCRFMGRNLFSLSRSERRSTRLLELGCGSGSNLWMLAREGFDAAGIDISPAALDLATQMLRSYAVRADLRLASMTALPFADASFDAVLDVFSCYSVNERDFKLTLAEAARVLKPGGVFFCYTPGKGSYAWTDCEPAEKIDPSTLNGIARPSSAYFPTPHAFRFTTHEELSDIGSDGGLEMTYCETVTRTYQSGVEVFEFVVAEMRRN